MVIPEKEKRSFPRLSLRSALRFQIRGLPDSNNAVTENISRGGVGFISNDFIAPETPVALEINILSRILRPFGRITWSQPLPHTNRYRVGVEFSEIERREKNYLADFINLRTMGIGGSI